MPLPTRPAPFRLDAMKPLSRFLLFAPAVAALLFAGCRLKDIRTVTLHADGVRCEACAHAVIRALAVVGEVDPAPSALVLDSDAHPATAVWKDHQKNDTAAVSKVVVHYDTGDIDVTYDSMKLAIKNLEFGIAAAGYDVRTLPYAIPADPKAREALPEGCRNHVSK